MDLPSDLRVPDFPFTSSLASSAFALERLRGDLTSLVPTPLHRELDELYRLMNSIVSARIEGNRTTVAEFVEGARALGTDAHRRPPDAIAEILQLEDAAAWIDEIVDQGDPLTHAHVREVHRIVTTGLDREGDDRPGSYREVEVAIQQSDHQPPLASTVHALMSELLDFANAAAEPQQQLVRMAIAHHRFVWIHPFRNGNGRVARLFSHAMLRSYGFAADAPVRVVNPTIVFGADRPAYYHYLSETDSLTDEGLLGWVDYVLAGLLVDMQNLRELTAPVALQHLIEGAIQMALRSGQLSAQDALVLLTVADGRDFKAGDLAESVPGPPSTRSVLIRSLLERQLIRPIREGGRIYRIRLSTNPLTPFLLDRMEAAGMLPAILRDGSA